MMTFMVLLVCAILCGIVANNKNRSVAIWVCLGFLFGVISLIIIACLGEVETHGSHK